MEKREQFVISKPEGALVARCETCGDDVAMVTVEQAAVMKGVSSRVIYQSVESGHLHFAETSDGFLLVCLNSLSAMDSKRRLLEPPQT